MCKRLGILTAINMIKIAIIIGSTRPNRNGEAVAKWVYENTQTRNDATFELVDIKDYNLPLLDEPMPPSIGHYSEEHTKIWSEKIASFDGYIFVTPDYNRSVPAALKNAIDFLYNEWTNKAAGFVGYSGNGSVRAIENLRIIMSELQIADVRSQVNLSLMTDFKNFREFNPAPFHLGILMNMIDQVIAWGRLLKDFRAKQTTTIADYSE